MQCGDAMFWYWLLSARRVLLHPVLYSRMSKSGDVGSAELKMQDKVGIRRPFLVDVLLLSPYRIDLAQFGRTNSNTYAAGLSGIQRETFPFRERLICTCNPASLPCYLLLPGVSHSHVGRWQSPVFVSFVIVT